MDKILVVDDDPAARRLVRAILAGSGCKVTEATNGDNGFNKAMKEKPHLIITDVLMPVKDGYQLAKELRSNPATASVPIIMLTALGEEQDELRAFQEGVDDYIVKPVRIPLLQARVAALLARTRALRGEMVVGPPTPSEARTELSRVSSGFSQLDEALDGGLPRGGNVLIVGEIGSGKSSLCRRFLAAGLRNLERCMMITLDDEPAMIRQHLDTLLLMTCPD